MLPIFSVGHYGESELKLPQAPPPPLSDRSVATVKGDWAKPGEEDRSVEGLSAIYTAEFFEMFADQAPEYAEVANALIAWWGAWAADSEVQKVKAAKLRPMHVYDVGCGPGQLIAALHARGVEARGMDGSRHAIEAADASVVPWIELGDLLEDPSRIVAGSLAGRERDATVTLVTCFEVAEHVPEKSAGLLVQRLCERAGPWPIVMTAATPGQGGHDHVNEQPKAYWRALFRRHGREEDEAASRFFAEAWKGFTRMPWMPRNVMVFR
jgi:SAM-dependent methyltransferase